MNEVRHSAGGQESGSTLPRSLWAATGVPLPAQPRLVGNRRCDVAIIGAGFTGLRAALGLALAGVDVVVLEAMDVGYGASGRNGGQVNPILRLTPDAVRAAIGARNGERLVSATLGSGNDLFDDIERFAIACDPVKKGWLQVAHTAAALKRLQALRSAWNAAGGEIALLDRDECREWSGSSHYLGGLFHPHAGHVHPLSLVRGFAAAAMERGATVFERSPALEISRGTGGKWTVRTQDGALLADTVVITTNGYTGDLWPGLKRTIMPFVSIQAATRPLTPEQRAQVLPRGTTIADTRRSIIYGRYDRDGRLSIGCMGSYPERPDALGGFARLRSGTERVFPVLKGIEWQFRWGGRIAVTSNFLPRMHEPAPGLLIGLGFNGRGVAMTSVMGRALAAKILGAGEGDLPFPVTPIKAVPLHRILAALLPFAAPVLSTADRLDRISQ